jgi:bifunctional non-homologous end joining protein LigD
MPAVPQLRARDTSLETYRARRDFTATPEPRDRRGKSGKQPVFVVQKHAARRLHWDFRLEHDGVLWSWAVPKGPSLDTGDKRLAVRTEDHPLDYAMFSGTIPQGHYGAGTVDIWDHGTWQPIGNAAAQLAKGELKFVLTGERLHGQFVLIRMKPRGRETAENWLLIKERDADAKPGADATVLERGPAPAAAKKADAPADGAVRGKLPARQAPQLAHLLEKPPTDGGWLSEVKFDGYRLMAFKSGEGVRLVTRNGLDWTDKLPRIAAAVAALPAEALLLDGELVALRPDGVSDFKRLQQALSDGTDRKLVFYLFDLLHQDGWDLRPCRLEDRKARLAGLSDWKKALRYSDHMDGANATMRKHACGLGLEGIVCKRADAPYKAGRGRDWVKLKCLEREEFLVLGWTPPAGSRQALGALHLGYRDPDGGLQYAGGVGTGFTQRELGDLRKRLDALAAPAPPALLYGEEAPEPQIAWVRPELVAEIQHAGWSGAGRVRHAVYLGLRLDKPAEEVVRPIADPEVPRLTFKPKRGKALAPARPAVLRSAPGRDRTMGGVVLTHPEREFWPGVTKRDLATYWQAVAAAALPELAGRPLALVRCPDGFAGQHFFQKHGKPGFPEQIRAGTAGGAPYLVIDDYAGLAAAAQVGALELHAWGAREPDALHPDRLVFDLDPGDGVPFPRVVEAAKEVRTRLQALKLASFCRTTGGKGLHVVVPLHPDADWDTARAFCRGFAEQMVADAPDDYVARLAKSARSDRILIDWLRNGLGSTAVASFSPRARPGATVATPLAWREVTAKLDPQSFTVATVPQRLARQRSAPWPDFETIDQVLPRQPKKGKRT